MGLAGISIPQLTIILLIAVMLFGTKRVRTIGGDLGAAIRSFRKAVNSPETAADDGETRQRVRLPVTAGPRDRPGSGGGPDKE